MDSDEDVLLECCAEAGAQQFIPFPTTIYAHELLLPGTIGLSNENEFVRVVQSIWLGSVLDQSNWSNTQCRPRTCWRDYIKYPICPRKALRFYRNSWRASLRRRITGLPYSARCCCERSKRKKLHYDSLCSLVALSKPCSNLQHVPLIPNSFIWIITVCAQVIFVALGPQKWFLYRLLTTSCIY